MIFDFNWLDVGSSSSDDAAGSSINSTRCDYYLAGSPRSCCCSRVGCELGLCPWSMQGPCIVQGPWC